MGLIIDQIGNGSLTFAVDTVVGQREFEIVGGPFGKKPADYFGLCLLERATNDPNIWFPIRDFSVPDDEKALRGAITQLIVASLQGRKTYVGCMAGQGRTGLVLSLVAKAMGVDKPVEYVREHYYPHAVETKPQYQYVSNFDADGIMADAVRQYEDSLFPTWLPVWARPWMPERLRRWLA